MTSSSTLSTLITDYTKDNLDTLLPVQLETRESERRRDEGRDGGRQCLKFPNKPLFRKFK